MYRIFILVVFLLLVAIPSVTAQEPSTTAPTAGIPEDNECYEGGSMWRENPEDRCDTPWHWNCGWWLARYTRNIITTIDDECQVLLDLMPPPEPVIEFEIIEIIEIQEDGTTVIFQISCRFSAGAPNNQYITSWSYPLAGQALISVVNGGSTNGAINPAATTRVLNTADANGVGAYAVIRDGGNTPLSANFPCTP